MTTSSGSQLAQGIRQKIDELKETCRGVDENTACRAPKDRWSPKEILSHLLGPKESSHLPIFQLFLDKETPTIEIDPGNPFYSEMRAQRTFAHLLLEVEEEYERISTFAEGLSDEQLARNAHVPELKESPLGDYPTLELMIKGLGQYHVQMHIDQMREILQEVNG